MNPFVSIRDATEADWPFIRESWTATFHSAPAVQGANDKAYKDEMARVFAAILPTASGRIASNPEDELHRLAFAVYEGPVLYFAYVVQDFRREGLVPLLLEGLGIDRFMFRTLQGERRLKPKDRGWQFHPRFTLH